LRRGALLAALFLGALALRPQLVGIGPLIPSIQADLDVSHAVAGLLATFPVLCMGLFAPPAAFLSQRFGSRHALAAALALIAVFGITRSLVPGAALVILLTIPVGMGMGLGNALMPVSVKERFADRPVFATGVYAAGINIGGTLSSATAVPLEHALGDWRDPLLVFSCVTVALFVLWLVLTHRARRRRARAARAHDRQCGDDRLGRPLRRAHPVPGLSWARCVRLALSRGTRWSWHSSR
jgi:MFS transporter, CP family, cyanate transporter